MSSKSGGVSGAVSFPSYMQTSHEDWLGSTDIDVDVVEAMNAILDPGNLPVKADCIIQCISGTQLDTSDYFALKDNSGVAWTFGYKVDGTGPDKDFDIEVLSADTAITVAMKTAGYINNSLKFNINLEGSTVRIIQLSEGTTGNQTNPTDTVTNGNFTISNFTGGVTASTQNPYSYIEAYDPTTDLDDILTDLATYKTFIGALDPEADLTTHADAVLVEADSTHFPEIDLSSAVAGIVTAAISDIGPAVTSARETAAIDASESVRVARTAAATDAPITAARTQALALADAEAMSASGRTESDADLVAVALSARDEASTTGAAVATDMRSIGEADAEGIITRARQKADADVTMMINSASVAAVSIIDSAPVAALIVQYGQRAEVAHLKTMNRFAGGMAEINAVQGSAFLFGMALLEAEHTEKVDEFLARLSLRIYESVIPSYLQAGVAYSVEQSRTEMGSIAEHLRARTAFVLGHLQTEAASIAEHMRAGTAYTGSQLEVESKFARDQIGLETDFSRDHLQTFRQRAVAEIRVQAGLTAQVRAGRDAYFLQAVDGLARMVSQQASGKSNIVGLSAEANRLKFVAMSEYQKQNILYDVEEWLWQLKVFQYGSNVLSGIASGGQVLPESPSQMSTVLSGAFTGAALGTAVNPGIGTAVGAVLGGIGGYFE